eukprot:snap_masked-scaffold293_size218662-processed-gene-1.0 protein:Tk07455 transcript:snap_masked-scaffold293_size218662-processed-gene-1.0-mRNA-1 annotation:"tryptophanyl-trna synthetase"
MTQFKDKSKQVEEGGKEEFISVGLLDYPVLQTADILIYKADYVPVGKDQEQHLELSRDIAGRFNHQVGKEYFVLPEGLYTETPKIRSTADPRKKMSKSAGEKHYISVFAEESRMRKQIKSAVTDTGDTPEGEMSPGVENLFLMMKAAGATESHDQLMTTYNDGTLKYSDLKQATADGLWDMMSKFAERKEEIVANKKELKHQIKQSSEQIRKKAQETMKEELLYNTIKHANATEILIQINREKDELVIQYEDDGKGFNIETLKRKGMGLDNIKSRVNYLKGEISFVAKEGYVGYDEGGQLTEAVRRKPYSIVLLDEIEKAHPDTFNILLQVLDDGRLTDNKGRVVNFKNTLVIMTSNMGAEIILENFEDLDALGEEHKADILETTKEEVFEALKENLRPEFLNRIDEKIMFLPLTKEEIKIIAGFMLKKTKNSLGYRLAIWDYDHSFGRDGDNELNMMERPIDADRCVLLRRLTTIYPEYEDRLRRRMAYFATDQNTGMDGKAKHLDIYQFELYEEARPQPVTFIKAKITDEQTGAPIAATIEIVNLDNDVISTKGKANSKGYYLSSLLAGYNYGFFVSAPGYVYSSDQFDLQEIKTSYDPYILEIPLTKSVPEVVVADPTPIEKAEKFWKRYMLTTIELLLKRILLPPIYSPMILLRLLLQKKSVSDILQEEKKRCQIFDFKRIQVKDVVVQLKTICQQEGLTAEPEALHLIGQKADGAMRDALSIFDKVASGSDTNITYKLVIQSLNILDYEYYFKVVDAFLMEDLSKLATRMKSRVLYVSGEESEEQIKMRADRIGIKNEDCYIYADTNVSDILKSAQDIQPQLIIIDSIQTLTSPFIDSTPGSISQYDGPDNEEAEVAALLRETAGKIYEWVGPAATDEMLRYDFTLVKGDTMVYDGEYGYEGIVIEVDTVSYLDDVPHVLKAINYDFENTIFSFIPNTAEVSFFGMDLLSAEGIVFVLYQHLEQVSFFLGEIVLRLIHHPKIFEALEQEISNMINNERWTDDVFQDHEKIKGQINITVTKELSATSFEAELSIIAARPVFNSTYTSQLIKYLDRSVIFSYDGVRPIQKSDNNYLDNLSSILTYYTYYVLGMDYDSFSPYGVASARSVGKEIVFRDKAYKIVSMEEAVSMKPDIAIFSAGGSTSLEWAPKFAAAGTVVIDNSSAWRMSPEHKLVVPEINGQLLAHTDKIIANPNCSTIQMVATLAPLHKKYKIKRLVISTYQSYTGTGVSAVAQYNEERKTGQYNADTAAYPHPIFANCLPHCDVFLENGYTKEEMKLMYKSEVEDLADTIESLSNYDNKIWTDLKNYWGKVQEQVYEKNLFREHAASLKNKTNELFDKLKVMKKAVDKEFDDVSTKHRETVMTQLADIETRIEKGMGLKPLFEELKDLQAKIRNMDFTEYAEVNIMHKAQSLAYYELLGDATLINKEGEAYQAVTTVSNALAQSHQEVVIDLFESGTDYAEMERLKSEGFTLLSDEPKQGADNKLVCFVHPKSAGGVLMELCQEKP